MALNIFLCGQKYFGQEVLKMLLNESGVDVVGVSAPVSKQSGEPDRLWKLAAREGVPRIIAGQLNADTLPIGVDLIIAAHSHDFIGRKTRQKCKLGAIGYHPSLLPLHRGRDAVLWAVRNGERVTGGSVYWLNDKVDGGPIAAQQFCFIPPRVSAFDLWVETLQPLGVALLKKTVGDLQNGVIVSVPQNEALATWEPSFGRQPMYRPDLAQIGPPPDGFRVMVTDSALAGVGYAKHD